MARKLARTGLARRGVARIGALLVLMAAAALAPVRAEPAKGATDTVERLHAALITVMREADSMDYAARRALIAPVIESGFDSAFMARVAAGSYWRGMSEAEQAALIAQFRAFTIANYAARFNGYSGERFETVAETALAGNREMVRTQLVRTKRDPVSLDYVLRQSGADWVIIDIFMNGTVSELATRRAEFAPILRDQGAAGLIASLAAKTADLAGESGAP
ncbi:MAG: hopanoid biosynthesis protein HpnM [Alphaproteobacteria bacterium]|nr:MAG: hopanoid biosynthesis protein HpnM [Alphaproteobacteria bacterium]